CLSALLAGIIATLGNRTLIFPALISGLPMLSVFRYPIKLMILPVWCLAILAARGARLVMSSSLSARSLLVAAACWTLLLLGGLVFLVAPDLLYFLLKGSAPIPADICAAAQLLIAQAVATSCALGLALSASVWAAGKWHLSKKITGIAI